VASKLVENSTCSTSVATTKQSVYKMKSMIIPDGGNAMHNKTNFKKTLKKCKCFYYN